ncbi:MAG TPA: hypothetical protein VIW45_02705 [Vicinamibacterales bacterium]
MMRSDRFRAAGWTASAAGLVGAAVRYWLMMRSADVALDDATALGYSRSLKHGMGMMMGRSGELLTDVSNLLTTPLGESLMIAGAAALVAAYCFRVAYVIDDDARRDS